MILVCRRCGLVPNPSVTLGVLRAHCEIEHGTPVVLLRLVR